MKSAFTGCDREKQKAALIGIDDKNGINACKLLGFTAIMGHESTRRGQALADRPLEQLSGRALNIVSIDHNWPIPP